MERNPAALAAWLWVAPEMKKPPPCPLRASHSRAVQQAASAARGCAELLQPAVIFYGTQTIRKAVRIGGEKPQTPLSARLPAERGLRMPLPYTRLRLGEGAAPGKRGKNGKNELSPPSTGAGTCGSRGQGFVTARLFGKASSEGRYSSGNAEFRETGVSSQRRGGFYIELQGRERTQPVPVQPQQAAGAMLRNVFLVIQRRD